MGRKIRMKKMIMDFTKVEEQFYQQIKRALLGFVASENNKDVHALAFDCEYDGGQICLRYANQEQFEETKKEYADSDLYRLASQNGLFGMKYSVGEYRFIEWQSKDEAAHFLDSIYYYNAGDYYGEGEPVTSITDGQKEYVWDDLKKEFDGLREIFEKLVLDCIEKVKKDPEITIDRTDDFIIYMCEHDIDEEEFEEYVRKTNDTELVDKLAAITD